MYLCNASGSCTCRSMELETRAVLVRKPHKSPKSLRQQMHTLSSLNKYTVNSRSNIILESNSSYFKMSGKNYRSGAQKRKIAQEKKQKEEDALKKVPKITQMFANKPSTSASAINSIDQSEIGSSTQSLDEIADHVESINLSDHDTESESSLSIATEHQSSEDPFVFPNDVALWDLQTNLSLLQKYWSKLGTLEFVLWREFGLIN